jgi:DNA primase
MLPDGQDPDDLIRSAGSAAMADVLAAARPLAEMLWNRETEAGDFATPERRAGLEARLNEVTMAIRHEAVRKYYRQDFETRLRALFSPRPSINAVNRDNPQRRFGKPRPGERWAVGHVTGALAPPSPRLTSSSIVRGHRTAMPPREALILLAVVNHPWLMENHAEDLADLDFVSADSDRLRRAILESAADHETVDTPTLRAAIERRRLAGTLARVETALTHTADWPAHPGAAPDDIRQWWAHVVTLHRRTRTLNKELRDAERALGEDPTEENLSWLRDVQERLAALDGTEATIEGFGALSGRPTRGL